jgi:hypothetical protein
MTPIAIVAIVIAVLAIAVAAWALMERQITQRLRSKFGPEYDRALKDEGNPRQAEAVLKKREERVSKYNIRELSPRESDRFAQQ